MGRSVGCERRSSVERHRPAHRGVEQGRERDPHAARPGPIGDSKRLERTAEKSGLQHQRPAAGVFDHVARAFCSGSRLVGRDRNPTLAGEREERRPRLGRDGLLEPLEIEGLEPLADRARPLGGPRGVRVDPDPRLRADPLSQRFEAREVSLERADSDLQLERGDPACDRTRGLAREGPRIGLT